MTDAEGPVVTVSLDDEEGPTRAEVTLQTPLEIACYVGHLERLGKTGHGIFINDTYTGCMQVYSLWSFNNGIRHTI